MKRYAVVLIAIVAFAAPAFAGGGFLRSVEAARKEAKEKNRLIFVDLFAEWCGWCHRFEKEVVPSEKFQQATKDKVLLFIDIEDGKEGTALARRFNVTQLPTFLLLTPELTLAGVIRGYAPPDPFAQELKRVETEYREFAKRVADEASTRRDPQKRFDLAKDFYSRYSYAEAESRFQAIAKDKNVPMDIRDQAYYYLALTQLSAKRHADAAATLKRFFTLESKGETAEQGRFLLGHIYLEQQNLPAALAEFRLFKTMYPKSSLTPTIDYYIPQLENAIARAQ